MTWQALNLAADEYQSDPQPPDIGRLLYTGKRHGISGPPESIKTIIAWILLLESVRAGNTVAVVDFEMGAHATRRLLLDLGFTLGEIRDHVVYYESPDEPDEADIAGLVAQGVTFVVIDAAAGAYDASSLDDNKRQDVERFARAWVRPLFERGITSVLIDHVTKNSETRGKYMIGSERKLGGVDVHLGLELVGQPLTRGGSAIVRVRVHKDRGGHLSRPIAVELHVLSDPESHRVTWEWKLPASAVTTSGAWRPTIYMERVSRSLEGRAPQTRTATYRDVSGNRQRIIAATNFLLADGYLDEVDGKLISTRPFRHEVPGGSRSVPDDPGNQSTAGSPVPKLFPPVPGTDSPGSSHGSPAYRREPGTGNGTEGTTRLLPGDPGYLHRLSVAKENGHVTDGEWERMKSVHEALARKSTPGPDQQEGARP
jgi:hypothetical protein